MLVEFKHIFVVQQAAEGGFLTVTELFAVISGMPSHSFTERGDAFLLQCADHAFFVVGFPAAPSQPGINAPVFVFAGNIRSHGNTALFPGVGETDFVPATGKIEFYGGKTVFSCNGFAVR